MERTTRRIFALGALLGGLSLGFGCGGGNDDSNGVGLQTLNVSFTANAPATPPAQSISMAGITSGASLNLEIRVTEIDELYGASFEITFDPATAAFVGFSGMGSVLGPGAAYDVSLIGPGELAVSATLQGPIEGVDVVGTERLITIMMFGTASAAGNAIDFNLASGPVVTTCPLSPLLCQDIPPGNINWYGGILTASE